MTLPERMREAAATLEEVNLKLDSWPPDQRSWSPDELRRVADDLEEDAALEEIVTEDLAAWMLGRDFHDSEARARELVDEFDIRGKKEHKNAP